MSGAKGSSMTILDRILATKQDEVATRRRDRSISALDREARNRTPPRGFKAALDRVASGGADRL